MSDTELGSQLYSFILVNKFKLSIYYVSSTVLGTGDRAVKKTKFLPLWILYFLKGDR